MLWRPRRRLAYLKNWVITRFAVTTGLTTRRTAPRRSRDGGTPSLDTAFVLRRTRTNAEKKYNHGETAVKADRRDGNERESYFPNILHFCITLIGEQKLLLKENVDTSKHLCI